MLKKILLLNLFFFTFLFSSYEEGEKIFMKNCLSCHKEYIPMNLIKENFFQTNNKLLNLKAPSANMIEYALLRSPKHLGDEEDKEMQAIEIEEFLSDYLNNPIRENSICDENIIKHYDKKEKITFLKEEDFENLSLYFMEYQKHHKKKEILKEVKNYALILKKAKKENKYILIYASSKSCYYCKKMDKEVFILNTIKKAVKKDYLFIKVNIDENDLPFSLQKNYRKITPTFFILNKEKKLLNKYPGSWNEKDFLEILEENIQ